MKRRGFTLLEVLVVVGIIAILSTLLVIGIGKLVTSSRRQQTTLMLENLRAMYAEYDSIARPSFGLSHFKGTPSSAMLAAISIQCPGSVAIGQTDRTSTVVQETRAFMSTLLTYPKNATAVGKIASASLMTFADPVPPPPPPAVWNYATAYNAYDEVSVVNSTPPPANYIYMRTQIYADSSGNVLEDGQPDNVTPASAAYTVNAPPNPFYWQVMPVVSSATVPLPTPVMLDAWNNPIIFVISGVLGKPSGSGTLTAGGNTFQVKSSDGRPFFASAGPDGDFSKGDDNLYSFDK